MKGIPYFELKNFEKQLKQEKEELDNKYQDEECKKCIYRYRYNTITKDNV